MAEDKLRKRFKALFRKDNPDKHILAIKDEGSDSPSSSVHSVAPPTCAATSDPSTQPTVEQLTWDAEHVEISLWDKAYDSLRDEKPELISLYEDLLSRVLANAKEAKSKSQPSQVNDASDISNEIPQHDAIARQEKLSQVTKLGLQHVEDRTVKITILGHKIILREAASNVAVAVKWAQEFVKDAIKDVPYAPAVMAGITLILPLLKNPATVEAANNEGFTYVTSQMRYYIAMEGLLLPDITADVKADLTERVIDLYKSIIDFQLQSVIRFYRGRTKNYFRSLFKYDDWTSMLKNIRNSETELRDKLEQVASRASIQLLDKLSREAHESRQELANILSEIQELVKISRGVAKQWSEAENRRCRETLQATDPSLDKARIEESKGGLLKDCYSWILEHEDFKRWRVGNDGQMLWIKGDPGKGKTMLLCGIIDELSKPGSEHNIISYFFCQATHDTINNAASVLRGLIYMLVRQQPSLLDHIRDTSFEGLNAWTALSRAFSKILEDIESDNTFLIIDALDECVTGLDSLLSFISQKSAEHPKVKWIVSSRNWPRIDKDIEEAADIKLLLELNESSVSVAVERFTKYKVKWLAERNKYSTETRAFVHKYLLSNSRGTFLWVALVCKELSSIDRWNVQKRIVEFPPDLDELYKRMFSQVCQSDNAQICMAILGVISMVYRPLDLEELITLVELPGEIRDDYEAIEQIIRLCGSFLTLGAHTVSLVHQSAKDFLSSRASSQLYPDGMEIIHHAIFLRSLRTISHVLKEDIYDLKDPAFDILDLEAYNPDPLAPVKYACIHWIDHLLGWKLEKSALGQTDHNLIEMFFKKDLLHWLEALSLIRSLPGGIDSMVRLQDLIKGDTGLSQLSNRVQDASRFMIYHRQIIDQHPLQIYTSSLIFSPMQSITKNQFKPSSLIIGSPAMEQNWSSCLLTIENTKDCSASLENIAWSPDGTQIASQDDINVKIWNSTTGQCTATLRGHGDQIVSLAWSQDGRLASACQAGEVRIWNTITNQCSKIFKGEDGYLFSLVWSPDGSQIARATIPTSWTINYPMLKTIDWRQEGTVWDTITGEELSNAKPFLSLGWSMDKFLTISPLGVDGVSIQEFATGQEVCILKDTLDQEYSSTPFEKVFWGQDQIAINHHTHLNVWDIKTCTLVSTVRYLFGDMSSPLATVSWSQHGIWIASGSEAKTSVFVWDEISDQETMLFKHIDPTYTLLWSPDCTRLATCSQDGTIRVWDSAAGSSAAVAISPTLDLHPESVEMLKWSPNLQYLASSSPLANDTEGSHWTNWTTFKIWDSSTSQCLLNRESVGRYFWSFDGNRIALLTKHGIEVHNFENAQYKSTSTSPDSHPLPTKSSVRIVTWLGHTMETR
ncbi:NACHT-domain-containing protein [Penicillium cosmopolitanum]|uniref:NACHT-domain-containing protein n=1 Tax=Penicillium cosmopolitanum TaxID=1131564 RepID=A0A9W9W088_9EURO|nr:NACHT-domain-containing protein [Penicillium cosmopolitanum]KAJ5392566.1 NACHT-domain-containing protein [Penicillium cosmopolitanum]